MFLGKDPARNGFGGAISIDKILPDNRGREFSVVEVCVQILLLFHSFFYILGSQGNAGMENRLVKPSCFQS